MSLQTKYSVGVLDHLTIICDQVKQKYNYIQSTRSDAAWWEAFNTHVETCEACTAYLVQVRMCGEAHVSTNGGTYYHDPELNNR